MRSISEIFEISEKNVQQLEHGDLPRIITLLYR